MVTSLCLMSCVLATAQPAERTEWLVLPRLSKAQELVYRGTFTEESAGGGVQFNRGYRFENRILVLDAGAKGADLALLTVMRMADKTERGEERPCLSARLELAQLDLQGKLTADPAVSLAAPLDGMPTLECGAFVEVPRGRLIAEKTWEVSDAGRPVQSWKVTGTAMVNGINCVKLIGVQQSDDWEKARADHTAWRRTDTVWINPRLGAAERVERVIERREPARKEPTQRCVVKYDLESSLQCPAQLFDDRKHEVAQIHALSESAAPLLTAPAKNAAQLDAQLGKITYYLEHQAPSPYRDAVTQLQHRVEAARKGESVLVTPSADKGETPAIATVGYTAPDFLAPEFGGKESVRPRRWLGKPVLMVFYNPNSATAEEILHFAQMAAVGYRDEATVVGLAMSEDGEKVRKQRDELHLTIPILNGLGLRKSYDVEATPKLMVLDAEGVVRGAYVGWGQETAGNVLADLKRAKPRANVIFQDPPMKK
jgi:peroxiredoxin